MPKTRKDLRCPIFGEPIKLNANVLPTYCDVIKYYLWIRNNLLELNNAKDPSIKYICAIIASDIEQIWKTASIPTISHQQVVARLVSYYSQYKSIKKLRSDAKKQHFFKDSQKKLFDIATCKCASRKICKCIIKVPAAEENFLKDQRNERKMYIGCVDRVTTKSLRRNEVRKRKYDEFVDKTIAASASSSMPVVHWSDSSSSSGLSSEENDISLNEWAQTFQKEEKQKENKQMRHKLPNLALACDRTGVSDRSAAFIVNAAMLDLNVIGAENSSSVIDRSKIRRERKKVRKELNSIGCEKILTALYFDGRKDKTLVMTTHENTSRRKTITEEHISMISEPNSEYIGHLSIESGKAANIQKNIVGFMEEKYKYDSSLVAIGCDGTAVNTGHKNGVIALLEKHLKRPLQWFVCLLHANELPLRHLFLSLDGTTTGPNSFSGCIGKKLVKCLDFKPEAFEAIPTELPEVNINLLSTDQKYLYEICSAISAGLVSPSLASRDPGKLAHSRWLTCANRILRLYIGTAKPSDNLKQLAIFIIKVYAPTWFDIKSMPSCKHGPLHVFNMVKRSSYLRDDLKSIVLKTIQRNSYFAHPENMLLAMLQDDASEIRELALQRVLEVRKGTITDKVREFCLPDLQVNATNYYDMIDWVNEKVTEPPMIMKYTDTEILQMINSENSFLEFEKFPCHTQAVERCVKLVTEASISVCGSEARDGFIRSRIKARQDIPLFETKSQFCKKLHS